MMRHCVTKLISASRTKRGFSLAELLVVVGVIAILMALLVPALQLAHAQALQTKCSAQLRELNTPLQTAYNEYDFYPYWDDGGSPLCYTWIDVLLQRGYLGSNKVGYCPMDTRPDPLNEARASAIDRLLLYPSKRSHRGLDYSYGIGATLSAGGWAWSPDPNNTDKRPRRFVNYLRIPSRRLLAADASWSAVFNLSADALLDGVWNSGGQLNNTLAYYRHPNHSANVLYQDGHLSRIKFDKTALVASQERSGVDTAGVFLWYPGEPAALGPDDWHQENWFPYVPPPSPYTSSENISVSDPHAASGAMPPEMMPGYYTREDLWTEIPHK